MIGEEMKNRRRRMRMEMCYEQEKRRKGVAEVNLVVKESW